MDRLSIRNFLIEWNYKFPLDKWWRDKHNVVFLSEEHKKTTQLQITLEYLEEKLFEEFIEEGKKRVQIEKDYNSGIWLRDREDILSSSEQQELFDDINIEVFNKEE